MGGIPLFSPSVWARDQGESGGTRAHTHTGEHTGTYTRILHLPFRDLPLRKFPNQSLLMHHMGSTQLELRLLACNSECESVTFGPIPESRLTEKSPPSQIMSQWFCSREVLNRLKDSSFFTIQTVWHLEFLVCPVRT